MKPQQFGDYTVRKLVEVVEPFKPEFAFKEFDAARLAGHADWLAPHFIAQGADGLVLPFSFHTYVVQAQGKTILIDTCIGNHKDRAALPFWHMQNRPYLDNLYAMGIAPEDVDYVMCTHLHADHVGWNTKLENGQWVPTFPNARYIFSKDDYDHYNNVKPGEFGYTSLADSVFPIVDAGLAENVTMDFAIGDGLSLVLYRRHAAPPRVDRRAAMANQFLPRPCPIDRHAARLYRRTCRGCRDRVGSAFRGPDGGAHCRCRRAAAICGVGRGLGSARRGERLG